MPLLQECKAAGLPDPVVLNADELLFHLDEKVTVVSLDTITLLKTQCWSVKRFKLLCLSEKHGYFVKVDQDSGERRVKGIKKEHLFQVIKKDLGLEVEPRDLIVQTSTKEYAQLLKPTVL